MSILSLHKSRCTCKSTFPTAQFESFFYAAIQDASMKPSSHDLQICGLAVEENVGISSDDEGIPIGQASVLNSMMLEMLPRDICYSRIFNAVEHHMANIVQLRGLL